jgi:hypothetical protein
MADRWAPGTLEFTGHALNQMFARHIDTGAVRATVEHGETIADYPDDWPWPSRLLLAKVDGRPIHIVLAYNASLDTGYVVTAYEPDPALWQPGFRQRRQT